MEDALAHAFVRNKLPSQHARPFAAGMCGFHAAHAIVADREASPTARCVVMMVPDDQFWPYTPHFRKTIAHALQALFGARITGVGLCPVTTEQHITFVDDAARRWIVTVEAVHAGANCVYAYFPRPNTQILTVKKMDTQELSSPMLAGWQIVVGDTTKEWD